MIKLFLVLAFSGFIMLVFLKFSYISTEKILGPNTKHQIENSFRNSTLGSYNIFLIGNSRIYRGVNPDKFKLKTFNLSYDGDSYLQTYYKLKFLGREKITCKYVILSADYFSFSFLGDNSNSNYYKYLDASYSAICHGNMIHIPKFSTIKKNNQTSSWKIYNYMDEQNEMFNAWMTKNISNSIIPFFQGLTSSKKERPFQRENGQYVVNSKATSEDYLERNAEIYKPLQLYLDSILIFCKQHDVEVFLTMLPTRKNELKNYSIDFQNRVDTYYGSFKKNKNVHFLNYKNDLKFTIDDFGDLTHFNEAGADKFSELLNRDIDSINVSRKL